MSAKTPRIAILGSPNVGKSTLFNRLLGKRRTITDEAPGVTRDPVEAVTRLDGVPVELIDTGGFESRADDELARMVRERSLEIGREAHLILLVVDVTRIHGDDREFVERLRPYGDRVILVANKVDNEQREAMVWELFQLGLCEVVGVSAEHGRNIGTLKKRIIAFLGDFDPSREEEERDADVCIAILGKPNTGKSTLSNRLLGSQKSIVTATPGTTRDVIEGMFEFEGRTFKLLDTAGIRRKTHISDMVEYHSVSRAISTIRQSDVVFLLIEATVGLTDQDKKIASLVGREGRGIAIVLSKWDLMEGVGNAEQAVKDRIRFVFPALGYAPIHAVSSVTGSGVPSLLHLTRRIKDQLDRRVPTAKINAALARWVAEVPPTAGGRSVKIRYATQVSANPVVFVFFTARPDRVPQSYRRYLTNRIREDFGFSLVPIRIELRASPGR